MEIGQFFTKDWHGPTFVMFGPPHLVAMLVIIVLNFGLLRFNATEEARRRLRWTIAILLWANEVGWHIWNYAIGQWNIQTMLPLHLCSVLMWAGVLGLVTRNHGIYEFLYFMGIAGALQAILTPDVGTPRFSSKIGGQSERPSGSAERKQAGRDDLLPACLNRRENAALADGIRFGAAASLGLTEEGCHCAALDTVTVHAGHHLLLSKG